MIDTIQYRFMKKLLTITQNTFVQGGILFTVSNFMVGGLNYLFNLLAGRALGPEGYGEIVALFSYGIIFSIPIGVLGTLLIQKIGDADDAVSYTIQLQKWVTLKLKKWWFILVLILFITPLVPSLTNLSPFVGYILPFMLILSLISVFYNAAMQGLHLFMWYSIIGVIATVIKLSGAVFTFFGLGNLELIVIFILLSGFIQLSISHFVMKKRLSKHVKKEPILTKRIMELLFDRQLWYTAGVTGVLTLLNNIDVIYVKLRFSAEDAGLFGAWSLFAKILLYVIGPLLGLSYIFFSNKKQSSRHQVVFITSLIFLAIFGFAANIGYGFFGRFMIESLFGSKYISVLPFIEWASLFGAGYILMMFMMNYFLAKKSKASLVPAVLFPIYLGALFVYPKGIGDVMLVDTLFAFGCVAVFLLIFFWERFGHLLRLFRS